MSDKFDFEQLTGEEVARAICQLAIVLSYTLHRAGLAITEDLAENLDLMAETSGSRPSSELLQLIAFQLRT